QKAEAEARAAAQEAAERQAAEEKAKAEAARAPAPPPAAAAETASAAPMEQPAPPPPREAAIQAAAAPPDKETKQGALPRAEVREIQTLLEGFGFDPGPIDGAEGPKTQEAAMRYRQSRGGADTGAIDRQLLEVLRRDFVPPLPPWPAQVAQRQ